MKIVACDNAANAVEGYVSYMKQFGVEKNQLINSKNTMLNYLRGFINRVLANKRNLEPEWKTCSWRDGYTPMTWYFTLYFLPQHRLVVIMAFYSKESKPGVKENRMVVRLTESKIREIVEESVRGILKEIYEDNKHFGWEEVKKIKTEATSHELKLLKKSYDKYGEECASRGETPNFIGFNLWCDSKSLAADGKNLYPCFS